MRNCENILTNEFSEPTINYKNTFSDILLQKKQISWKNHNGSIKVLNVISLDRKHLQKNHKEDFSNKFNNLICEIE